MNARETILVLLVIAFSPASAFSKWSKPEPVVKIFSKSEEKSPFLSFDGLTLYFAAEISPSNSFSELYQASRTEPRGPFNNIEKLNGINFNSYSVAFPWVSPDNLRMYYQMSQGVIMFTERVSTNVPWLPGFGVVELNVPSIQPLIQPFVVNPSIHLFLSIHP